MSRFPLRFALGSLCASAVWLPLVSVLAQTSIRPTTTTRPTTQNATTGAGRSTTGGGSSSNASSASATRQYRNNTMLGDALIQVDPETRSLVIVADERTQAEIAKVIHNLDRPKPQVLIKVLFAQVTLDNSTDFGVEGSYQFNVGQPPLTQLLNSATGGTTTTAPSQTTTTTTTTPTANGGSRQVVTTATQGFNPATTGTAGPSTAFGLANQTTGGFFKLNTYNATATLYALAQRGKVKVLSRPSILARNNQEAVMVVGQEVPFITNSQITENGQTINTIQYQDVGIILRVTPFITSKKTVEMIVSPEISSLSSQTVPISPTVNAPLINKTSAETVVVTPDATTVVIGGMMQKQETSTVNKVPLLGDIPVLGYAFRHTVKSDTKTELLIFLTPYIVEGTDKLEDLSVDQMNRTDLPQNLTEREMNKYLDNTLELIPPPAPKQPSTTITTTRRTTTTTTKNNGK